MIRAAACVLAGMLLAQLISFPPATALLLFTVGAIAIRVAFRGRSALSDLGFLLAGCLWFLLSLWLALEAQLDRRYEGDSVLVDVKIIDFPDRRRSGTRFLAEPMSDGRLPGRLKLSWYEPPVEPCLGDVWRLEVRLRRPRGRLNPGGGDVLARHLASGIGATGYVVAGWHNRRLATAEHGFVGGLRARLDRRIQRVVDEPRAAAVLSAVGLGARHRLSAEQKARFAATGTSHLMAISGLHIGLAAVAGYALVRMLLGIASPCRRPHGYAVVAGLCIAALYACLSGFAVPARRATLMLLLAAVS
ncbi:MAG: ComEC/Rec2 family competence protein, partial [Pseudomonadota bacterium]